MTVKGAKGELKQEIHADLSVSVADGQVTVERPSDNKEHRAMHGLYRTLINNMVIGVSEGYKKELELVGVGYKADARGQVLELNLGFSRSKESTSNWSEASPRRFVRGVRRSPIKAKVSATLVKLSEEKQAKLPVSKIELWRTLVKKAAVVCGFEMASVSA
mgnify:CR=1 FL=1